MTAEEILNAPYYRIYEGLGAQLTHEDGVAGVRFSVWAPNAKTVQLMGDFNAWDSGNHAMQGLGDSGVWSLFVPGLGEGTLYKYIIHDAHGAQTEKADPMAFASELRPRTASKVWDINKYAWNDSDWMHERRHYNWLNEPISVYEMHPGSWKRILEEDNRPLSYMELAEGLIPYVKDMGFTHIELMPVSEHPFDGSWGYQCLGYFAPTSRFGSPDDFKGFVDACHQAGIGVIIDWVPAHFPEDPHGLAEFDGSKLYEHADPRKGKHMDWGTLIFNFGRDEVKHFLYSSAMIWADIYHVDGLRVDAVASMLYLDYSREEGQWEPNIHGGRENLEAIDFLKHFNELMHREYPGLMTFAEESTSFPGVSRPTYTGGLGFSLKWNMGWMNDILNYIEHTPIHRCFHHNMLTFSLTYAFSENFILPFSHDEVVHEKGAMLAKMPGDRWQQFANLRLLYAYLFLHPGKKLLFMGNEFGQWTEWNHDRGLDWQVLMGDEHEKLRQMVAALNHLYVAEGALHQLDFDAEGFYWLDHDDKHNSVISFVRTSSDRDDYLVCALNFTPVPRDDYRIALPEEGEYTVVFNSDAEHWGGNNAGQQEALRAEKQPLHAQPCSANVLLPPLGALVLRKA